MAGPANSLNITQPGVVVFDGVSNFLGRTITAGTGITITNGNGILANPTISVTGGAAVTSVATANSTAQFVLTGSTETIDFGLTRLLIGSSGASLLSPSNVTGVGLGALGSLVSGSGNTALGTIAGNALQTGVQNTLLGFGAMYQSVGSSDNVAVGVNSLASLMASSGFNVAMGTQSAGNIVTGRNVIAIGYQAGNSHTLADSSNIDIGNLGTAGESNVIRIGTQGTGTGQQNKAFVAGITGVTVSGSAPIGVDTNGQISSLGFGTAGQSLISGGAATSPSWITPFTGFVLASNGTSSPADSTTYYLISGQAFVSTSIATNTGCRFYAKANCTLNQVIGAFRVGLVLGSAENGTFFIVKNNTTTTNLSTTIQLSAAELTFNFTGIGITLVAGDYVTFGFTTPAWATNPTGVGVAFQFSN